MPTIGARFDIQKVGGGFYGFACWKIFWRAIEPEHIRNSNLHEGDTDATRQGRENVFCIAVQCFAAKNIETIKAALGASEKFLQVAANPTFVEGNLCAHETLADAGRIDATGNLVGEAGDSRAALGSLRKERAVAVPAQTKVSVQPRTGPASERTRNLPSVSSFEELRTLIGKMFTPPEYPTGCGSEYWMTPEELADIVDKYADMALIVYEEYSCGSTEDMCCVRLYDKTPPGRKPIEFIGLYPFASEADARNFGQDWHSAPDYAKALPRLAGVRGKYQFNFGRGNEKSFGRPEEGVSAEFIWERLSSRKERFLAELQKEAEAKRHTEEQWRLTIQRTRKSKAECIMCGKSLGFLEKMLRHERHSSCTTFSE